MSHNVGKAWPSSAASPFVQPIIRRGPEYRPALTAATALVPADRLHQRDRPPARARGDASARSRGLRRAPRRPGAARGPAPDREGRAQRGGRSARAGGGRGGAPWTAGGGTRRGRAPRRRGAQRDGPCVHARAFGGRRAGVRRAPALQWSRIGLVRALNERTARAAGGFRLLRSNRARAGTRDSAGGRRHRAARRGGPAPAQLRRDRHRRSRIRPDQRDHRAHRQSRGPPGRRVAAGGGDGETDARFRTALVEALTRLERVPGVAAVGLSSYLPLASRRHAGWIVGAGRRSARAGRLGRPPDGVRCVGKSGATSTQWACDSSGGASSRTSTGPAARERSW